MRSRFRKSRPGFVLVIILVVLAVVGTLMAAAARRSGDKALLAGQSQRELQLKWGMISCQEVFAASSERVLRSRETENGAPTVTASSQVVLGGMTFDAFISDEQAKANVNCLYKRFGEETLAADLRELQALVRKALVVRLKGKDVPQLLAVLKSKFSSFDCLYEFDHPCQLAPEKNGDNCPTSQVTCWGNGQVNFKRASAMVIRKVLAGLLTESEIDKLVRYRDESPDCMLQEAVNSLDLKPERVAAVMQALTDISFCHSVWIIARGQTRNWYRLCIATGGYGNTGSLEVFVW